MDPPNRTSADYLSQDDRIFNLWNFYLCGRYKSADASLILLENGRWTLTSFDFNGLPFNQDQGQWSFNGEDVHFADCRGKILFSAKIDGNIITLSNGIVLKKA